MISRLAYGPVALGLDIPAGEQTWLGSVPLELPGDVNRNRCGEEGPRGGRLREDMSDRSRKKAGKSNASATQRLSERETRKGSAPPCRSSTLLHAVCRVHGVEAYRK